MCFLLFFLFSKTEKCQVLLDMQHSLLHKLV